MFILCRLKSSNNTYPKYIIFNKINIGNIKLSCIFHYLIISFGGKLEPKNTLQGEVIYNTNKVSIKYLIVNRLFFSVNIKVRKFDISRLGTDFIINNIGMHFKSECIGSYPENYIFVKEPVWPTHKDHIMDRSPLKYSHYRKTHLSF